MKAIAGSVVRNLWGADLDGLVGAVRSELDLKPFLPEFSDTELRHAIADALMGKFGAYDPLKAGKYAMFVNSEGKTAETPVDASVHVDGLLKEIAEPDDGGSLGFGISDLDQAYGGFYPGDVMALVGAPGSMKTSLALNMAYCFWRRFPESRMAFFSLDMSTKKLTERILQRELDEFKSALREKIRDRDPDTLRRVGEIRRSLAGKGAFYGWKRACSPTGVNHTHPRGLPTGAVHAAWQRPPAGRRPDHGDAGDRAAPVGADAWPWRLRDARRRGRGRDAGGRPGHRRRGQVPPRRRARGGWGHVNESMRGWAKKYPKAWAVIVDHARWANSKIDEVSLKSLAGAHQVSRNSAYRIIQCFPQELAVAIINTPVGNEFQLSAKEGLGRRLKCPWHTS
jgi:hypothetical protein